MPGDAFGVAGAVIAASCVAWQCGRHRLLYYTENIVLILVLPLASLVAIVSGQRRWTLLAKSYNESRNWCLP